MASAQVQDTPSNQQAIKYVIENNHEALKKHIKDGGDFMGYDSFTGWAPIHFAVHLENMECLEIILAAGGNVDQPTIGMSLVRPEGGDNQDPKAASAS